MKKKGRAEEEREKDEEGEERERKKMPSSSRNNISNIKERFIQSKNIKEKTKNKKFRVCSRGEEAEQWINNVYRLYIGLVVFFFLLLAITRQPEAGLHFLSFSCWKRRKCSSIYNICFSSRFLFILTWNAVIATQRQRLLFSDGAAPHGTVLIDYILFFSPPPKKKNFSGYFVQSSFWVGTNKYSTSIQTEIKPKNLCIARHS